MKARPILFSGPMIRALLEGRKTQTRRIVKPSVKGCTVGAYTGGPNGTEPVNVQEDGDPWTDIQCPYGQPGDLLWARESWTFDDIGPDMCAVVYKADDTRMWMPHGGKEPKSMRTHPGMHMFRWASRLTLRIKAVRVERLNAISQKDAEAEGLLIFNEDDANLYYSGIAANADTWFEYPEQWHLDDPIAAYRDLTNSINGPDHWDKNPWVWVVEFEVIQANVDRVLKEAA